MNVNKFLIILSVLSILIIPNVLAYSIEDKNPEISITPGGFTTVSFLIIDVPPDNVTIYVTDPSPGLSDKVDIGFSKTFFTSDGTVDTLIHLSDDILPGNYNFNVAFDNGISGTPIKRNIKLNVTTGIHKIWSGYLHKGDALMLDDYTEFVIDELSDTAYHVNVTNFGADYVNISSEKTLVSGNTQLRIKTLSIIRSLDVVEIELWSNYDYEPSLTGVAKKEGCILDIRTITTMVRGQNWFFEVINKNDGSVIPDSTVTLLDGGGEGENQLIDRKVSDSTGFVSVFIPKDTKGPVVLRLSSDNCTPSNSYREFKTPYNTYIENQKQYTLVLSNVPDISVVNGNITGIVTTLNNESIKSEIDITDPSGTKSKIETDENGFFTFTPIQPGKYSIFASKTNYEPSDIHIVEVSTDSDNDGIPDTTDKCPAEYGYIDNSGCPLKKVIFKFYKDNKEVSSLKTDDTFTIKMFDSNGNEINKDIIGNVTINGNSAQYSFINGESIVQIRNMEPGTLTVSVPSFDIYDISTGSIEVKSGLEDIMKYLWIFVVIIVVIVLIVIVAKLRGKSSIKSDEMKFLVSPK